MITPELRTQLIADFAAAGARYTDKQRQSLADKLGITLDELTAEIAAHPKAQPVKSIPWQTLFRLSTDLQDGELIEYVKGILPEGVTFLGALSGVGKTWFALALAHSLLTGEKLFTIHAVHEKCNVLYLSPEVGDRAFRKRLVKLRIFGHENFRCQTQMDGVLDLSSSSLETYCGEMKPVVFLDTAIRFNPVADENSASQNAKLLAHDIFRLRKWGAKVVVCLHHSPKYAKTSDYMTLENVLRGTGDIGAMCDAVWGMQHEKRKGPDGKTWDYEYEKQSEQLTRLLVRCVKPRDFDAVPEFVIQGRPFIDERGTFGVIDTTERRSPEEAFMNRIQQEIERNVAISQTELCKLLGGMNKKRLLRLAKDSGWEPSQDGGKFWIRAVAPAPAVTFDTGSQGPQLVRS